MNRNGTRGAHARVTPRVRRLCVAGAVVVAVAVGGGISLAAVGDGGVITGCVKGDSWRVISTANPAQSCKPSETQHQIYSRSGADAAFLDRDEADALYRDRRPTQYQVIGEFSDVAPTKSVVVEVSCHPGDIVTGGGYVLNGLSGMTVIAESMSNDQRGWRVSVYNPTAATNTVGAQAMCLHYP